jgi:putative tryptophan/tyrosine transport system substrate-binding protein
VEYLRVSHLARDISEDNWSQWKSLAPKLTILTSTNAAAQFKKNFPDCSAVFLSHGDPVRAGLVTDLLKPGGQMTGVSTYVPILARTMETLRDAVGRNARIGLVVDSDSRDFFAEEARSSREGVDDRLVWIVVDHTQDFRRILDANSRVDAWVALPTYFMLHHPAPLLKTLLTTKKLVAVNSRTDLVMGAHIGVWSETRGLLAHLAAISARVASGEPIATMRVESPVLVKSGLNILTLSKLGISLTPAFVKRFDEFLSEKIDAN